LSGLQIALDQLGVEYDNYYASEIDKYAIKVAQANYPNTIQLGDITKWREWDIDFTSINLIAGGFPCVTWSVAGRQAGDNDPRGMLVHTLIELWKHVQSINPDVKFLFENVRMKRQFLDYVDELFGIPHVEINSSLVSAQNRKRCYWASSKVSQPEDEGITLRDVIDSGIALSNIYGGFKEKTPRVHTDKSPTIMANSGGGSIPSKIVINGSVKGRYLIDGVRQDHKMKVAGLTTQMFEPKYDGKTNTLTTVSKDNIMLSDKALAYMDRKVKGGRTHWEFKHHSDTANEKSSAVVANFFKGVPYNVLKDNDLVRSFTPEECEMLQTIPQGYTNHVSKTQRLKMIGNGYTIEIIKHILKDIL
jgi:site-specific DNA-cytosine methylase